MGSGARKSQMPQTRRLSPLRIPTSGALPNVFVLDRATHRTALHVQRDVHVGILDKLPKVWYVVLRSLGGHQGSP